MTRGELLTTRQVVERYGIPEKRLRRLVAAKKIPVHRDGRLGFWSKDVEDWIEKRRTPSDDEQQSKHIELAFVKREAAGIEDLMPRHRRLGG
jgi:predicted DNA-binding transcriptional regulator AlpA